MYKLKNIFRQPFIKPVRGEKRRILTGFTLLEIVIVVIIVMILAVLAVAIYTKFIRRSQISEAIVNLQVIKQAQEVAVSSKGTYLNASDTEDINRKLSVHLVERIFRYRVENATEESFVAIAERIDDDEQVEQTITLARGPSGHSFYVYEGGVPVAYGGVGDGGKTGGYVGAGGQAGGSSATGGTGVISPGGGGVLGGGGSGSSGGGSTGGGSGGGTGGGGTGGGGGVGSTDGGRGEQSAVCGDGDCDYTESCETCPEDCGACPSGAIVDAGLQGAFDILAGASSATSIAGGSLADLLNANQVIVKLGTGCGVGAVACWQPYLNTIDINVAYWQAWSDGAIAAVLAHEALHADYSYNPYGWIAETLERHPELSENDLHIITYPFNSIDQEYNAFKKEAEVWNQVKDGVNDELDYVSWLLAQGEDVAKARIREVYSGQALPEY